MFEFPDFVSGNLAELFFFEGGTVLNLVEIESLDNPQLDAYVRLTEAQLRNRLEPEKGIFIAESPKVIARALDAGMHA